MTPFFIAAIVSIGILLIPFYGVWPPLVGFSVLAGYGLICSRRKQ